jgi:nitrogen regulatory protein P-II 2
MDTVSLKIVTIVAERVLRDRILKEIRELGARGFTLTDTSGEGSRGVRASEWEGLSVKIETIVGPELAERIVAHVAETYFRHFAVIVYVQPADVVRKDKYL